MASSPAFFARRLKEHLQDHLRESVSIKPLDGQAAGMTGHVQTSRGIGSQRFKLREKIRIVALTATESTLSRFDQLTLPSAVVQ